MKRLIILALALALAPEAGAQLYKYVDKDGKTVYTDQPPANIDSKQINSGGRSFAPPAPPAAAPKNAPAKDADKNSKDGPADKAKKAADDAAALAQNEQRCSAARGNYQMYMEGGRIQKTNEKGERELLSDAEIESMRASSRREMEEACKK